MVAIGDPNRFEWRQIPNPCADIYYKLLLSPAFCGTVTLWPATFDNCEAEVMWIESVAWPHHRHIHQLAHRRRVRAQYGNSRRQVGNEEESTAEVRRKYNGVGLSGGVCWQ
jgi:hypothetical protein